MVDLCSQMSGSEEVNTVQIRNVYPPANEKIQTNHTHCMCTVYVPNT